MFPIHMSTVSRRLLWQADRVFAFHFCAIVLIMRRRGGKGIAFPKYEYIRVHYNRHCGKRIDSAASPMPFQKADVIHDREVMGTSAAKRNWTLIDIACFWNTFFVTDPHSRHLTQSWRFQWSQHQHSTHGSSFPVCRSPLSFFAIFTMTFFQSGWRFELSFLLTIARTVRICEGRLIWVVCCIGAPQMERTGSTVMIFIFMILEFENTCQPRQPMNLAKQFCAGHI